MVSLRSVSLYGACILGVAHLSFGDVVEITDGSSLQGEIVKIHDGVLSLETSFAGTLEISLDQVSSFSSSDAETVRFADGSVAIGPVQGTDSGEIIVAGSNGAVTGATADVAASWAPGDRDPEVVASEAAISNQVRQWSYEAALGLTGKSGNSTKSDYNAAFEAQLEGPSDRLVFYTSYQYSRAETADGESEATTDEIIGGVNYTNFFSEHFGWYVREEIERDRFEGISFRSTTALGGTYRPIKEDNRSLEFFGGLSLRYEGYTDDAGSESYPGLDFGLKHYWKFAEWGEMNNSLTYNPSFDDFGDYRVDHLSTVDLPLGTADYWKLRFSLQNQYNSEVSSDRENMDTTYALSLLLKWD